MINPPPQGRATGEAGSPLVPPTTSTANATSTSISEKRVQDSNSVSEVVQTEKAVKSVAEKKEDMVCSSNSTIGMREDAKDKVTIAKEAKAAGLQSSIPSLSNAEKALRGSELGKSGGIQPAAVQAAHQMAPHPTLSSEMQRKPEANKESQAAKALEKINAVQQALKQQQNNVAVPAKQTLEGIMHVTPKTSNSQNVPNSQTVPEQVIAVSLPRAKAASSKDDSPKIATVRRAAERFERHTALMNSKSVSDLTFSPAIRGRSKSIGDALRTRFVEDQEPDSRGPLPWAGKSPPASRRKEGVSKGYALQMSKSCDSITAAKMLAKARAENSGHARINQNFSKSIERQIDVYSKTKEDIRKILNLAKVGSIKDRVSLFDNLKDLEPEPVDPEKKAEAIRLEIVNARAQAQRAQSQESVSDTEIEFQAPIESKVKPIKISRKPSMSEKTQPAGSSNNTLRINQSAGNQDSPRRERRPSIEDLPSVRTKIKSYIDTTADEEKPKPILKNEKERSRSPRKSTKAPKLLGDHFLSPNQSVQIYAQSATDLSATEDECETSRREPAKKLSVVLAEQPEPGPVLLQVPPKPSAEARPGIMKSKSFASSSGQYECSIDESSGKKMQMMAFFGQGGGEKQPPQKTVRIKERQVRSSSISSITDEMMAEEEEDLEDIDAEFESLLNKTFEKESRRLMTAEESEVPGRRSRDEKAKSREESAVRQTRRGGRGTVSLDMSNAANAGHFQQHLRKSNSISSSSGSGLLLRGSSRDESASVSSEVGGGIMYPSPVIRQKNFDPVGALPTSSGRREAHSPSPTQSEYDTCDPWDDY